jgi:O-antigen/teichoic acid export membrane protein
MFKQLKEIIKSELSLSIIHRSVKLMVINLVGVILLFITNLYLIKILGERIYGQFVTVNVWLSLLNIVILFGMDDLFILVLPKTEVEYSARIGAPAVLKWSFRVCMSLFVTVVILLSILFLHSAVGRQFQQYAVPLTLGLLLLVIFSLLNSFFRAMNLILRGQFLEKILRTLVVAISVVFCYSFNYRLTFNGALYIQVTALLVCVLVFAWDFGRRFGFTFVGQDNFDKSGKTNLSFLGISLLNLLASRVDILILSTFSSPEQVGYYNIAGRISDVLGYPATALYLVVPTLLSREWLRNREKAIQILKTTVLVSLLFILVGFLFLVVFGKHVLLYFGENFIYSYWPMIILCAVNIFSVFSLPVNTIMMVNNKQKFSFIALIVYVLFILLTSSITIPRFGAKGAAIAMLSGSLIYLIVIGIMGFKLFRKDLQSAKSY